MASTMVRIAASPIVSLALSRLLPLMMIDQSCRKLAAPSVEFGIYNLCPQNSCILRLKPEMFNLLLNAPRAPSESSPIVRDREEITGPLSLWVFGALYTILRN